MSAYENYKPAPIDLVLEDSRLFRKHTVTDNVIFHSRQEAEDFSDLIKLEMVERTNTGGEKGFVYPADIIITGDVPINDMQITVKNAFTRGNIKDLYARVFIMENSDVVYQYVQAKGEVPGCIVGYIMHKIDLTDDIWVYFPLIVPFEEPGLSLWWHYGIYSSKGKIRELNEGELTAEAIKNYTENAFAVLRLWYKIEIALLHPVIQDVLTVSGRETAEHKPTQKKKRKRPVKYIKRRMVSLSRLPVSDREYHRTALAWYVIGHYRQYKSGKRIFIRPYWKGELREIKAKYEQRDRIVEDMNDE